MYLAHLEEACLIMGLDTQCSAKDVTAVSHGLARAGRGSLRRILAIPKRVLTQIGGTRGWRDQITLIAH